jgi:hypothetical protein
VIATRFDTAFAHRHRKRDRRDGPREPRGGRGDDRRDDGSHRYSDPAGDWRGGAGPAPSASREARLSSADELYGNAAGRGQDHRPAMPGSTNGGLVLDVPEFIPGH